MSDRLPALKDVFSYKNLVHAIAGASGSSVAITAFYPLDIARTKVQVDDRRKSRHTPGLIYEIAQEEGFEGLYRGWFPVVTSICCSNFVYFYVFNSLKAITYPKGVKGYPAKDLVLAYLAGAVNVLTTTPLWVANTRVKLQGTRHGRSVDKDGSKLPIYTGMIDCLSKIIKFEGIPALWSGTVPSLVLASNPAIHFAVYEALKRYANRGHGDMKKELSGFTYFMLGALAKMIATMITYPLQIVQSRLRAGKHKSKHGLQGMYDTLKEIYRNQGVSGLYKGMETKLTQTMLMAALMFVTYEKIANFVFRIMRAQANLNNKTA